MSSLCLKHDDYIVGWICALSTELTAARAMLDETHADLPQPVADHNAYCLGRIGGHNIVMACLPKGDIGTNAAAKVATRMAATFRSMRFGLMVGLGGGVPSQKHDIRLGDVVVGLPGELHGGVVQWDLGKTTKGGHFKRTGILNRPPPALMTAISKLESTHQLEESKVSQYLLEMAAKRPKAASFTRRPSMGDFLFHADYDHFDSKDSCDRCDTSRIVSRPSRNEVAVHYGLIASGNQVIKNGTKRDQISQDLGGALCFEMEAAGLINEFPCIVIRGISDYADSHKNKHWQKYAAATAAAFAKELLNIIPPSQLVNTSTVDAATLENAADLAGSAIFSPSGRQLTSISGDQSQMVCDYSSATMIHTPIRHRSTQEPKEVDVGRAVSSSPSTSIQFSSSSDRTSSFEVPIAGPNDIICDRKDSADSFHKKKLYKNARPSYSFSTDGRSLLLWARDTDNIVVYDVRSGNSRTFCAVDIHLAAGGANIYAVVSKTISSENLHIHYMSDGTLIASVPLENPIASIALSHNDEYIALGTAAGKALVYNRLNKELWCHDLPPLGDLRSKCQRVWFSADSKKVIAVTRNANGAAYTYINECNSPTSNYITQHINIPPGFYKDFGISSALYDNKFQYACVTAFSNVMLPTLFSLQDPSKLVRLDKKELGTQIQCATSPPNPDRPEFVLVNGKNNIFSVHWLSIGGWQVEKAYTMARNEVYLREEMTVIAMPTRDTIYAFWVQDKQRMLTTIIGGHKTTSDISGLLPI